MTISPQAFPVSAPHSFGFAAKVGSRLRPNSSFLSRFPHRRGFLLYIVVIVISMLTLGGLSLLALMRVEREATSLRHQELQLSNASRSGVVLVQAVTEMSEKERIDAGGIYDNPKLFSGEVVQSPADGGRQTVAFTVLAPKFDRDAVTGIRYGLVNESNRLNLGAILEWDEENPGTGREVLMKLPGMTAAMADSILDWLDADERTRPLGAEGNYYAAKKLPYSPRNAVPVFLEELLLVRDVTRWQLYGADENFNFGDIAERGGVGNGSNSDGGNEMIGSLSAPPDDPSAGGTNRGGVLVGDSAKNQKVIPWSELLTVFSAERDVDPKGEARIDLNGDDLSFLFDELNSYVNEETAAFVVLWRQFGPYSPEEKSGEGKTSAARPTGRKPIQTASGGGDGRTPETAKTATADAVDFSIEAAVDFKTPLDLIGEVVFVPDADNATNPDGSPAGVFYRSPFPENRRSVAGLFDYLDYVSTSPSTIISGRVNVNEAPRPVLEAVPGLDEAAVQRILNSRGALGGPVSAEHRHAVWLWSDGVVNLETMKGLWAKLTTGGDVFRGQVIGFVEGSAAANRGEVVVDGTVIPSRQVFYKDLTMYGRGFPMNVLQNQPIGEQIIGAELRHRLDGDIGQTSPFSDVEAGPIPDDPFAQVGGGFGN